MTKSPNPAAEVALVTGGAQRIGAAIARRLSAAGYAVAIHCYRSRSEADALAAELSAAGGRAIVVVGDLADTATPDRILAETERRLGRVTLLVNNASIFERDAIGTFHSAAFDVHMAINLRAPLLLSHAFAARLPTRRPGAIVNITDQRVRKPVPDFLSYGLSKAGLDMATCMLAQALAPRIRVNAVAPGPTLPNNRQSPSHFRRQAAATLLQRASSPEDIAAAALYLAGARSTTGVTIFVDGGQHLAWQTPDVAGIVE
jgi:NAD(P)-dependent dehydrogenase (short-subunit alcohol dehydrogenase family)